MKKFIRILMILMLTLFIYIPVSNADASSRIGLKGTPTTALNNLGINSDNMSGDANMRALGIINSSGTVTTGVQKNMVAGTKYIVTYGSAFTVDSQVCDLIITIDPHTINSGGYARIQFLSPYKSIALQAKNARVNIKYEVVKHGTQTKLAKSLCYGIIDVDGGDIAGISPNAEHIYYRTGPKNRGNQEFEDYYHVYYDTSGTGKVTGVYRENVNDTEYTDAAVLIKGNPASSYTSFNWETIALSGTLEDNIRLPVVSDIAVDYNYNISYVLNGGTHGADHPTTGKYGTTFHLDNPTKNGYRFAGWTMSNGDTAIAKYGTSSSNVTTSWSNGNTPVTAQYFKNLTLMKDRTVTLTATWEINSSTLKVNPNGGTVKVTSPTGGTQETITTTKSYTQNYNTKLSLTTPTKADTTSSTNYTVTYKYNYGSVADTTDTATHTVVTGYTFNKWTKSNPFYGTLSTDNKTYTFSSTHNVTSTITATYLAGSSAVSTTSVNLPNPTRPGYTLKGWYTAATGGTKIGNGGDAYTPSGDITLYAQWTANSYRVIYNGNGGTQYDTTNLVARFDGYYNNTTSHSSSLTTWKDMRGNLSAPITNGTWGTDYLVFDGTTWVNLGQINSNYMTIEITFSADEVPTATQDLIGNWQVSGGGIFLGSNGIIRGQFYIDGEQRNVSSGVTIVPNEIYHVVLTYDGTTERIYVNGEQKASLEISGTITPPQSSTIMVVGGDPSGAGINKTNFVGKVYNFSIWNTARTATQIEKDGKKIVTYGSTYGTLPTPERNGYTFNGWYTDPTGGSKVTSTTQVNTTGNRILYARWTASTNPRLTIDPNGGSVSVKSPSTATAETITDLTTYQQAVNTYLTVGTPTKESTSTTSTYTITYNANDGFMPQTNTSNTKSSKTDRVDYTFSSWTKTPDPLKGTLSGTSYKFPTDVTSTDKITASYTETPVSGTRSAITLPEAGRIGYTFLGWYTAASGGTRRGGIGDTYTPSGNETLYAHWSLNNYTISYNLAGGTNNSSNPASYNVNSSDINIQPPTRNGYEFVGWQKTATNFGWRPGYLFFDDGSEGFSNSYSSSHFSGLISLNGGIKYTISNINGYDASGIRWKLYTPEGIYLGSGNTEGNISGAVCTPSTDCYAKILFFRASTEAQRNGMIITLTEGLEESVLIPSGSTGNISLTANWEPVSSTLNVDPAGGTVTITDSTGTIIEGNTETIDSSTPYIGKYNQSISINTPTRAESERTTNYLVTFNYNWNGQENSTDTAIKSETVSYGFNNWTKTPTTLNGSLSNNVYTYGSTKNAIDTITATYTESLTDNGTSSIILPTPNERKGYTFTGWYTTAGGQTKVGDAGDSYTPTGDITLYARWSEITYNIEYTLNGGTHGTSHPNSAIFNTTTSRISNPTKVGHTFLGWTMTNGDTTTAVYGNSYSTLTNSWNPETTLVTEEYFKNLRSTPGTVTLVAHWKVHTYTVEYYQGNNSSTAGATLLGTSSHTYGVAQNLSSYSSFSSSLPSSRPNNTWSFAGWSSPSPSLAINYTDGQEVNNLTAVDEGVVKLFAVFDRDIIFYVGVNKAGSNTIKQKYNPYRTSDYISSITVPSIRVVSGWNAEGYRADTLTDAATITVGTTIVPAYNSTETKYYSIYSKEYTVNFYSGVNKATNSKIVENALYNTNTETLPTTTSITLKTASDSADITNWEESGWRDDTTAGAKEYDYGQTGVSVPIGTSNFYSIYTRNLTVSYNGNGNTGGSTGNTTKTIYLNANSTNTSTQSITAAANGFTKTGYTFDEWNTKANGSGTAIAVGGSYNPSLAYNATTFGATLYAQWTANTYTIEYYQGNNTTTAGSTKIGSSSHTYGTAKNLTAYSSFSSSLPSSKPNSTWSFAGWSTTESGTTVTYTNSQSVSDLTSTNGGVVKIYAVFERNITFISGVNKPAASTSTVAQKYNPYKTTGSITSVTPPALTVITNWQALGYRNDTTASTATVTAGTAITPAYNATAITYYGVYSRKYNANFYSGVNKEQIKEKESEPGYYNSNGASLPTTVSIILDTATNSKDISGWEEKGWRDDTTNGTKEYDYGVSATVAWGTNFYSVYSKSYDAHFYSGVNKATETPIEGAVNYNTNTTTVPTTVTITTPTVVVITNWTKLGWRDDTTAGAAEYGEGQSISVTIGTSNFYGVYSNSYTANFYSGVNHATNTPITDTVIYNSNTATLPTTVNITLKTANDSANITNWTEEGWRDDTTDGDNEYSYGQTNVAIPFGTSNFYSTYSRILTVTYNGNGATGGSTANSTGTVYMNTYDTTTGAQSVQTNANGFTWPGHTAVTPVWNSAANGSGTAAGANTTYTLNPALAYNVSSFTSTLYAQWNANIYTIQYFQGNNTTTAGSTKIGESSHTYGVAKNLSLYSTFSGSLPSSKPNSTWSFAGWSTSQGGTTVNYTDGQSVSDLSNQPGAVIKLYAVFNRNITFISGVNKPAASTSNVEQIYNPYRTTGYITAVTAPKLTAITNWQALGYRNDTTAGDATVTASTTATGTVTPTYNQTALTYYGVYSRTYNANFYSGINKVDYVTKTSGITYYNTNSASVPTNTTITMASDTESTDITNWTERGWRDDTTSADREYTYGQTNVSVPFGTNFYSIYSRSYEANFYSGTNKAKITKKTSSTSYYNTNTASTPTSVSITLDTAANSQDISGWTEKGWRDDTITGAKEYDYAASATVPWGTNFYSVYERNYIATFYSGVNKANSVTKTSDTVQYNTNTASLPTSTTITMASASDSTDITNWTEKGWRDDTTTGDREYTYGQTNVSVPFGTNFYSVYTRGGTFNFYSGVNNATNKPITVAENNVFYNTNSSAVPTTVTITLQTAANATAIANWNKSGWRDDTTNGPKEYEYGQANVTIAWGTNFYSIYDKAYTANFYSGVNKATNSKVEGTVNYNSNTTTLPTTVTITTPTVVVITNWNKLGWRDDTTAGAAEYGEGQSISVAIGTSSFYGVYNRSYTANFYSGVNKEQIKPKTSSTVNYNSDTASLPTSVSITLDTAANSKDISGWEEKGWRDDTTNGTKEYDYGVSATVAWGTNFYSIYSKSYTANFYSGVNSATNTPVTGAVNYNTNTTTLPTSTTITTPTVVVITNWNKLGWRDDTTAGAAEYGEEQSISVTIGTSSFYGVYNRAYTANFYSGVNKGTNSKVEGTVNYNTNTTTLPTTTTITLKTASDSADITNWTEEGWRDDTTAAAKEYNYGQTGVSVAIGTSNFYSVYRRDLTISYDGNGATSGSTSDSSLPIYLNANSTTTSSQAIQTRTNGYIRNGYTEKSPVWNTAANGSGTGVAAGSNYNPGLAYNATSFDKILYAQWKANEVTITIRKDNSNWTTNNNIVVELRSSTNTYNNGTKSNATVSWSGVTAGTYNVYASKSSGSSTLVDTGIDVIVTSSGTATIDYYTLTLEKGIGISAVTGGGIYLKNQAANIDATVANGYTWEGWSVISGNTPQ